MEDTLTVREYDIDPDDPDWQQKLGRLRKQEAWEDAIPRRFQAAHLDGITDQDPALVADLRAWATEGRRNLVLLGPVGVGKTYAAIATCRERVRNGSTFRFVPMVELLDQLRPGGSPSVLSEATSTGVLILDDLGIEKPSEWTAERLYSIINRRWMDQRPIIATTNLPARRSAGGGASLEEVLGERTYSRLMGDVLVLRLSGSDRRRNRSGEAGWSA